METLTYSSGRASGRNSPGLLNYSARLLTRAAQKQHPSLFTGPHAHRPAGASQWLEQSLLSRALDRGTVREFYPAGHRQRG